MSMANPSAAVIHPLHANHVDPMPAGRLAVWLFLASEVMFFAAIIASHVVLRSGTPGLFAAHSEDLSKPLAILNTIILLMSSATIAFSVRAAARGNRRSYRSFLVMTLLFAGVFCGIKLYEYSRKLSHYTIVAIDPASRTAYAYDGVVSENAGDQIALMGYRAPLAENFDIHAVSPGAIRSASGASDPVLFQMDRSSINHQLSYGPWKNNFLAGYFTLTGLHVAHMLAGMIAMLILVCRAFNPIAMLPVQAAEYVALYWYFVDVIWLVIFTVLYLI